MEAAALGSEFLRKGFVTLTMLLAIGTVWTVYLAGRGLAEPSTRTWRFTAAAAIGVIAWMTLTWQVAASGVLADFTRQPPPALFLFLTVAGVSMTVAFTRYGTRLVSGLPLWILVLGQGFRLPLELLMHQAALEGVMPEQMSYSGLNFDVVTGATALPVAWWLARGHKHGRMVATAWNALGSLLLINIVTIAMLSTPLFAAFGPDRLNVWVAHPPYVWLPTMMVVCAMTGHLVIYRKLRATATPRL